MTPRGELSCRRTHPRLGGRFVKGLSNGVCSKDHPKISLRRPKEGPRRLPAEMSGTQRTHSGGCSCR